MHTLAGGLGALGLIAAGMFLILLWPKRTCRRSFKLHLPPRHGPDTTLGECGSVSEAPSVQADQMPHHVAWPCLHTDSTPVCIAADWERLGINRGTPAAGEPRVSPDTKPKRGTMLRLSRRNRDQSAMQGQLHTSPALQRAGLCVSERKVGLAIV